jgi:hypothetical protein
MDLELKSQVDGWLERAEQADKEEDAAYGKDMRGDELPDWVKDKAKRRAKVREAMARLKEESPRRMRTSSRDQRSLRVS